MAVYTSYDQVGLAEDVSDIITDITPTDTPFFSMIKSEKVSARVFEWQEDSLAAAANNAQVEGAAFTAGTLTPTTTHKFFSLLHQKGILRRIYTQNIDALEYLAGVPEVN